MTLSGAYAYIPTMLATIADIKYAPANVPESSVVYPFATVLPNNGTFKGEQNKVYKGLHEMVVTVHFNRSNLPQAYAQIPGLIEGVAEKLRIDPTLGGTVQTVISSEGSPVRYNVRYVEYADIPTLALEFFITVKIYQHEIGLPSLTSPAIYWSAHEDDAKVWQDSAGTLAADEDGDLAQLVEPVFGSVDATQATSGFRPVVRPTAINSHRGLSFNGLNRYLIGTGISAPGTSHTIYAVYQSNILTGSRYQLASSTPPFGVFSGANVGYLDGSGTNIAADVLPAQILCWRFEGGVGATVYRNGTSLGTGVWSGRAIGGTVTIGVRYDLNSGTYMDMTWGALAVYDAAHSASERTQMFAHLGQKWGITVA